MLGSQAKPASNAPVLGTSQAPASKAQAPVAVAPLPLGAAAPPGTNVAGPTTGAVNQAANVGGDPVSLKQTVRNSVCTNNCVSTVE